MHRRRDLLNLAAALPLFGGAVHGSSDQWTLRPAPGDAVVLTQTNGPTRLVLPVRRCRVLATFDLHGLACAAVRFGGQTASGDAMDLLLVAASGRLLALEPWAGAAPSGAHLSSRLDLLPLGGGLSLSRDTAVPNASRTAWRREAWTDRLVADAGGLRPAPVRSPPADSQQAAMARRRVRWLRRSREPGAIMDDAMLATVAVWPWEPDRESPPP